MAGAAVLGRLAAPIAWRVATVVETVPEIPPVTTIALDVPDWPGHLPGQHVDVRLIAEDGYQAQRSYSIASAPAGGRVELTVERLDDGEVSPYLTKELAPGDGLELRGPIGGYFVWDGEAAPLFLLAGGSGIVPLMAMLRNRAAARIEAAARLLFSSRSLADVIYRQELDELAARRDGLEVFHTLTRSQPAGWTGYARRVDAPMLAETGWPSEAGATVFVCGPTAFVEAAATILVELGYPPERIRTERFGPTGG
ncbi:MAG: ferredoxin reductase [Thermoleophilaceae bacterium]